MEPEGMTRAWPMVPLISRKARPTQNQAMISRRILVPTGTLASDFFFLSDFSFFSAFTMHHHRPQCGHGLIFYCSRGFHCNRRFGRLSVGGRLAHFQLHEIGRIDARITRRTETPFGISDGLLEGGKGEVTERVSAEELAD